MANKDNECKDLNVNRLPFPDFDKIFNMQKELQENTYDYKFKNMTLHEIAQFWFMNKHALEDEMSEMFDALGGIKDGIGNAVWKPWKKENELGRSLSVRQLSEGDRKELMFEIVDMFHFFMNFAVSCGFSGSDIANGYMSKNKENIKRQQDGY